MIGPGEEAGLIGNEYLTNKDLKTEQFCFRSLVVFNPTEQFRTSVISVVVDSPDARVVDVETGRPVAAQISAVWAEPSQASKEAFQVRSFVIVLIYCFISRICHNSFNIK